MEAYKIVKEYSFSFENLEHPVHVRISKSINIDNFLVEDDSEDLYILEFSHFYKPSETAGFYHKSKSGNTIDKLQQEMILYIKGFEYCVDTELNKHYTLQK